MADSPAFKPEDIVSFMTNSAAQVRHNAYIRSEFKKLQQHVEEFAKIFEEGFQVPEPKVRAKRGTGEIAMKKKAQAPAPTTPDLNQVKADTKAEISDIFTTSKGNTLKVPGMTQTPAASTPKEVPVIRKEDQKK